jgi:putative restriction endonuclease
MDKDQRRKIAFLREGVAGELSAEFASALTEPKILESVVTALLHTDFPETTHQGILDEVNLSGHVLLKQAVRDPHFRKSVMLAYEFRCAFCGYDGRINSRPVGIQAAHVKMHSKGGPDDVSNGIALCSLHHLLFDSGVLSLSDEVEILVSQYFLESGHGTAPSVTELVGRPMRHPQSGYELPAAGFLRWHRENLFTEPARS